MKNQNELQSTISSNPKSGMAIGILRDIKQEVSAEERVQQLYNSPGGPLLGWLFDEARRRGHDYKTMSRELGVTYGYINQLRTGIRNPAQISQTMATACSRYLGVPTVVVKLICGSITMSDFAVCRESKEEKIDRALRQMQDDPHIRTLLPCNLHALPTAAKEAVVLMYSEATGHDVLKLQELPDMLRWLQRAAVIHDENGFAAMNGHRDTA